MECYDQVIKLNPNFSKAYLNKGAVLSEMGQKQEAIECYDQAIKLNPNYVLCYCNKGKVLMALGREHEALECFNKVYELSQTANLRSSLSYGNMMYIKEVLTKDWKELIHKLEKLQVSKELEGQVDQLLTEESTFKADDSVVIGEDNTRVNENNTLE